MQVKTRTLALADPGVNLNMAESLEEKLSATVPT